MSEKRKRVENTIALMLVVFAVVSFLFFLRINAEPSRASVEARDMPNGVICYTYFLSIDCLQVDR